MGFIPLQKNADPPKVSVVIVSFDSGFQFSAPPEVIFVQVAVVNEDGDIYATDPETVPDAAVKTIT